MENCLAYFLLGNLQSIKGNIIEAIKLYDKFLIQDCKKANKDEVFLKKIDMLIKQGNIQKADDLISNYKV